MPVFTRKYQDRCLPPISPLLKHFQIVVAKLFSVCRKSYTVFCMASELQAVVKSPDILWNP